MYIYIYIYCVYIYIYRERERDPCTHIHTHTHTYIYIYIGVCVCSYLYLSLYLRVYIYIYIHTNTYIHIYIYTHICTGTYMYTICKVLVCVSSPKKQHLAVAFAGTETKALEIARSWVLLMRAFTILAKEGRTILHLVPEPDQTGTSRTSQGQRAFGPKPRRSCSDCRQAFAAVLPGVSAFVSLSTLRDVTHENCHRLFPDPCGQFCAE